MNSLLKFITCGSVDDGKSTLIGHILYDAKLLYTDQEEALALDSKVGSRGGEIDYSLLLDGLMAEREQGITIDVAYRYFTTERRSFIVADTPGHEEYTRNMAVGASFADLAVILVDATQGVLVQTRRHARICALMGINYFVFAVNKMDLAGYSEETFQRISEEIRALQTELSLENVIIIPVSATAGDNVTSPSGNMSWYKGATILSYLEEVEIQNLHQEVGFYLPVQRVCRPDHTFRGFQGQVESGTVRVGDVLTVLPSGSEATVVKLLVGFEEVREAVTGQPVTVVLDREIDVSRGCVLKSGNAIDTAREFETELLWMDDHELLPGKEYFLKLGTRRIPARVSSIVYRTDINTGEHLSADSLSKNEIALCRVRLDEPIPIDRFKNHRTLGELILIDRLTNQTAACGVVRKLLSEKTYYDDLLKNHEGPGFNTKALHSVHQEGEFFGSTEVPVFQTSAFAQESAEDLERIFAGVKPGFAYSRLGNPTVNNFERRMAKLEGGISATATASGSAAVALSLLNVLQSGDEILAPTGLYGGTFDFFRDLEPLRITVKYLDDFTPEAVDAAITEKTRVVYGETIGNPKLNVLDIPALAEVVHRHGLPLFIDNTTATPYLVNPLSLGADIVVHSTSKYINSNGSAISGVIVDGGSYLWTEEKFPALSEHLKFRKGAFTSRLRNSTWRNFGATCAPVTAYLNINGLETLGLRMARISENALALAEFFRGRDDILEVNYPGLSSSPYRSIVSGELHKGYAGGILTIRVGSKERAFRVMNRLQYAMKVSNIGDTKTLVLHPASTIFAHSAPEFRERAGVFEDLIRISVGIEDAEDLVADFAGALDAVPME